MYVEAKENKQNLLSLHEIFLMFFYIFVPIYTSINEIHMKLYPAGIIRLRLTICFQLLAFRQYLVSESNWKCLELFIRF